MITDFQLPNINFVLFDFRFILKFRYQIFFCLCTVTVEIYNITNLEKSTWCCGSETHKVSDDGEIL